MAESKGKRSRVGTDDSDCDSEVEKTPKTPKRRPNFSELEKETLEIEVQKRDAILFSKFTPTITFSLKRENWEEIAAAVTNASRTENKKAVVRTWTEVQTKWKNIAQKVKKSIGDKMTKKSVSKTGGGPPDEELTERETRLMSVITRESILGVPGGIDIFDGAGGTKSNDEMENVDNGSSGQQQHHNSNAPASPALSLSQYSISSSHSVEENTSSTLRGSNSTMTKRHSTPKSSSTQRRSRRSKPENSADYSEMLRLQRETAGTWIEIQQEIYLQRLESKQQTAILKNVLDVMQKRLDLDEKRFMYMQQQNENQPAGNFYIVDGTVPVPETPL